MSSPQWQATGVVEAPLDRVLEVALDVQPGHRRPLVMAALPGVRRVRKVRLSGGPERLTVHYGRHESGFVEVDRSRRMVAFQGGFKFRGELWFDRHERGTVVTYKVYNVAPESHRNNPMVRLQFWLSGRLRIGLRGILRTIERRVAVAE